MLHYVGLWVSEYTPVCAYLIALVLIHMFLLSCNLCSDEFTSVVRGQTRSLDFAQMHVFLDHYVASAFNGVMNKADGSVLTLEILKDRKE